MKAFYKKLGRMGIFAMSSLFADCSKKEFDVLCPAHVVVRAQENSSGDCRIRVKETPLPEQVVGLVSPCTEDCRDLTGLNVLVVGGSRGNGKGIAERLAKAGANVIATSRNPSLYPKPKGYTLSDQPLDLRWDYSVAEFFTVVIEPLGHLDILVNCGAQGTVGPMYATTAQDILDAFQTHIMGFHRCTKAALPYMTGENPIVLTLGSVNGELSGFPLGGPYAMAKRALQSWNDTWNQENLFFEAVGLPTVNATFILIEPSYMRTDLGAGPKNAVGECLPISYDIPMSTELPINGPLTTTVAIDCIPCLGDDPFAVLGEQVFQILSHKNPKTRYLIAVPGTPNDDAVLQLVNQAYCLPVDEFNLALLEFGLTFVPQCPSKSDKKSKSMPATKIAQSDKEALPKNEKQKSDVKLASLLENKAALKEFMAKNASGKKNQFARHM